MTQQLLRQKAKQLIGSECLICGSTKILFHERNFQPHQNTTPQFYIENHQNFIPLCKYHHRIFHDVHSYLKWKICRDIQNQIFDIIQRHEAGVENKKYDDVVIHILDLTLDLNIVWRLNGKEVFSFPISISISEVKNHD